MKAALVYPLLLILVLFAFASLLLLNFSVSYDNLFMLSSTHIFRYSVFSSIIFVILARSFRSSAGEADEFLHFAELLSQEMEEQTEGREYASEDSSGHGSDDHDSHCGSGGYEDDYEDDSHNSEMGYIEDDDNETDSDLENKAEAFISRVIAGWKEELMMDKLLNYSEYWKDCKD
ncbi:hypothetical protein ACET3Z_008550 [Daucus carota]